MARTPTKPPATPTDSMLREAALRHLARYAATQAGLLRVLDRKIARWAASDAGDADQATQARAAARVIVARLAENGAVSDTAFAASRTTSLRRAGKSTRAIGAHLATRGVPQAIAHDANHADGSQELAAAAIHVRKRRLGPYRTKPDTPDQRRRELASLARAGFAGNTASRALRLSQEDAEQLIIAFRATL